MSDGSYYPIDTPTDAERAAIWEHVESFVRPHGNGNTGYALHIPGENDGPLCDHNLSSGKGWTEKPAACFPPGYRRVCSKCVQELRDDGVL